MSNKKFTRKKSKLRKRGYEEKLEPLIYDKRISESDLKNFIDITKTKLVLSDYDWMYYALLVEMTTKEYGDLKIKFWYCCCSTKEVETENRTHSFEFDSDIFKEYIIKYLRKHIKTWHEKSTLSVTDEVIDFYNAVLSSPKTIYRGSEIKSRHYSTYPGKVNSKRVDGDKEYTNIEKEVDLILEPIIYDEKRSAFNLANRIDLFDSVLVLEDYDRMMYTLSSRLPTKAYGDMNVMFMYTGESYLQVKAKGKTMVYIFNADTFEEHVINFIKKHIRSWRCVYGFSGTEEIVDFYNAVLTANDTVEDADAKKLFDVDNVE